MWARWSSVDKRPFLDTPRTASLLEHRATTTPAAHSRQPRPASASENAPSLKRCVRAIRYAGPRGVSTEAFGAAVASRLKQSRPRRGCFDGGPAASSSSRQPARPLCVHRENGSRLDQTPRPRPSRAGWAALPSKFGASAQRGTALWRATALGIEENCHEVASLSGERAAGRGLPGVACGQAIVKLFFAGVGSAPPALTARSSNVYLPGFRCL
jgi:hypothetical protein